MIPFSLISDTVFTFSERFSFEDSSQC